MKRNSIHRNVNGRITKQVYKGNKVFHLVEPTEARVKNTHYPTPNFQYLDDGVVVSTNMALYAVERLIK